MSGTEVIERKGEGLRVDNMDRTDRRATGQMGKQTVMKCKSEAEAEEGKQRE